MPRVHSPGQTFYVKESVTATFSTIKWVSDKMSLVVNDVVYVDEK